MKKNYEVTVVGFQVVAVEGAESEEEATERAWECVGSRFEIDESRSRTVSDDRWEDVKKHADEVEDYG